MIDTSWHLAPSLLLSFPPAWNCESIHFRFQNSYTIAFNTLAILLQICAPVHWFPVTGEGSWTRIRNIISAPGSVHLLRHIHKLEAHASATPLTSISGTYPDICQFPFTHLHTVVLYVTFEPLTVLPLQYLLSTTTLQRLVIRSGVADPEACVQVWDRVSPSVTHVDWVFVQGTKEALPLRSTPITLESLRLRFVGDISLSLTHPQSLFDFSHLRALSLDCVSGTLLRKLAPALQRLEILEYFAVVRGNISCDSLGKEGLKSLDLSHLRALTHICVVVSGQMQTAIDSLLTLTSTGIRKLIIYTYFLDADVCAQLDTALDSPPLRSIRNIAVSVDAAEYDSFAPFFLLSRSRLCHIDPGYSWFEAHWFLGQNCPYTDHPSVEIG
ncbi:hypothetical protein C8R43DRAFT_1119247 [Mycena crocata]|nr:hypothetical protein C8R43DRAFT_1119247 [Mycena crocata]